ncbi:TRAP transporter large permease subunit [bacterium]|nr:TRAP transporter large permease subunit [bacterium]
MPILLAIVAVAGAPLFAVIAASALSGFASADIDLSVVAIEIHRITGTPVLIAIPLFTFAGYLLGETKAPGRLLEVSRALLGWMPGGLPIVALIACALFTAFTGASGVTIVALGGLLFPAMQQEGYRENFNLGLITTSGSLGLLFAPAIPLILYGIIAEVDVDRMFEAGLLPGILMIVLLGSYSVYHGVQSKIPLVRFDAKRLGTALRAAAWEIPLPFVVLGGIYGGIFAVSEAAAVTAMYVLLVEVFVYREMPFSRLPIVMRDSMVLVGGILIILAVSYASTNYLIDAQVPMRLVEFTKSHVTSPLTFLMLLNLFLLVLGCMLDIFSAIVIVLPLLLPMADEFGIDRIHLGIIFLANMQIGYCTPPVGMNLFIASYRFDRPILQLYRATIPFLVILLLTVLIITYWPDLSLFLVNR